MHCSHCGSLVPEGNAFCPVCGAALAQPDGGGTGAPSLFGAASGSGTGYQAGYDPSYQAGYDAGYGATPGAAGPYGQAPYGGAPYAPAPMPGMRRPDASRSFAKIVLLNIVTCGIYHYIAMHEMIEDVNVMCEGDREETPGIVVFIVLSWVTAGFYSAWWYYKLGNRLQRNAPRYGLSFKESGTTVLVWMYAGCLLCCIGPFIALYILVKNTNAMAAAYNRMVGGGY